MKALFTSLRSHANKSSTVSSIESSSHKPKPSSFIEPETQKPKAVSSIEPPSIKPKIPSSAESAAKKPKATSSVESLVIGEESISTDSHASSASDSQIQILATETIENLLKKKKKIGSGATSTVYKVVNIFSNKGFFALKVLNNALFTLTGDDSLKPPKPEQVWGVEDDRFDDEDEEEEGIRIDMDKIHKLYKEYEILKSLNHPNIIKIYGFFLGDKTHPPAILLEFCKFNLENAIRYLEDVDLVGIIYEICSAMMYIHKMKIIHRDLKVTNILVDLNKHVRICDFGISKAIDMTSQTSFTNGVGTLLYMAPELCQIDTKYDRKVDVYAFGVCAYFILTKGQYPSNGGVGCLENAKIPKTLNKYAMSLIRNCWRPDPKNRPSFQALRDFIVKNNFMLINGIESKIPALKKHLGLE